MVSLAESLGVDSISFTHLWYWDQSTIDKQHSQYSQFGQLHTTAVEACQSIDPRAINDSIRRIRSIKTDIPVMFYPDLSEEQVLKYYLSSEKPVINPICRVPWLATYIRPNGDVAPCYLNYATGNIKNQNFSQIWRGKLYRELRQSLKENGPLPACHRCTGGFLFHSQTHFR
jgi:radical SAM protein with 4Fe4S-binding SPASM domain